MSTGADSRIGTEFAHYRIERLTGRGGMSVVYQARDLRLGRTVALKLLSPEITADVAFRERFLEESRLAASIDHPHVVPVFDAGEHDAQLYIAMRYVDGDNLKGIVRREGALEPGRVVAMVEQLAAALDAAHAKGLVHRDVKPGNVLVDADGNAYLSDFGLTRRVADGLDVAAPGVSGTVDYVAPEQLESGEVDHRADVYSLGCLVFECLTGTVPFPRGSELAVLWAHVREQPPRPSEARPGLGTDVDRVVERALAKRPGERYPSAGALADALRVSLVPVTGISRRRRPVASVLAIAAVAGAAVALALVFRGGGSGDEVPLPRDVLVRLDGSTGKIVGRYSFGRGVSGVAVGGGFVWVTSVDDSAVWRFDPRAGRARRVAGLAEPQDVVYSPRQRLVLVGTRDGVAAIEPGSAAIAGDPARRAALFVPSQVAAGGAGIWVTGFPKPGFARGDTIGAVDVIEDFGSPTVTVRHPVVRADREGHGFDALSDLAVGGDAVWAIGDLSEQALFRIDPATGAVRRTPLPGLPGAIAAAHGAIWIADVMNDVVLRVDAATGEVDGRIDVGRAPSGIAAGTGALWVSSAVDGAVTRIDASTGRTLTYRTGGSPRGLAVDGDAVWVAVRAS